VACFALAALTLALPSEPSYDPWAWIIWGREVLAGDLRTATGPSWKPLPVLFTAPLSLFGDAAPELWLLVARAATFGALIAAASLGFRLAGRPGAVLAGALLLPATWLWEEVLLGNSEGVLILCVLTALDRHLAGRAAQAFSLGMAAALLRPEAWPFLGLYAVWLVLRDRSRLSWVPSGLMLVPALWFLPELWGSGSLSRAAERAQQPDSDAPAFAARPALAVLENGVTLTPVVVLVGLLAGLAAVALRRVPRGALAPALGLAVLALGWLVMVAGMAELGFSGINRYLLTPLAIAHVLAGAGLASTFRALLAARRHRGVALGLAGGLAALAIVGVLRVAADWPRMMELVERRAAVTGDLDQAIARAGGEQRLEACGSLHASFHLTPPVAWTFERHLEDVTVSPRPPGVVLRARLFRDEPLDPPANALAGSPGRQILARTKYWEVEAACGEGSSRR